MAESNVNDKFVICINLQQEDTLKRKQPLSSTNYTSSFQSYARHFLAWNRTVF